MPEKIDHLSANRELFKKSHGECQEIRFVEEFAMTEKLKKKLLRAHKKMALTPLPKRVPWPDGTTHDPNDRCSVTGMQHARLPDGTPLEMTSKHTEEDIERGTTESVGTSYQHLFIGYDGALYAYSILHTRYCACIKHAFSGFIYSFRGVIFVRGGWEKYITVLKKGFAKPLAPTHLERFFTSFHPTNVVQTSVIWGIPAEKKNLR